MVSREELIAARRRRRTLRIAVLVTALGTLVGLVSLGLMVRQNDPDYYEPARTALVSAREQLEASYSQEAALLAMLRKTHHDLEAAIRSLDKAKVAPRHRRDMAILRERLRALEDVERLQHMTPDQLHESYREIELQLSNLIGALEAQDG